MTLSDKKTNLKNTRKGTGQTGETGPPRPVWLRWPFMVTHLVSLVLIASWCVPAIRVYWDHLDVAAFRLMNDSLGLADWWALLWAILNRREIDVLSGSMAVAIVLWWVWGKPRAVQNWRVASLGALSIPLLLIPFAANKLVRHVFEYQRHSPTLVFEDSLRLTKLVPWMETKDFAVYSFPGDHAFILCSIFLFFLYNANRKYALVYSVVAFVFTLPRLFGGAHWLSDDIVAGILPSALMSAWMWATPFGNKLTRLLLPIVNWVVGILPRWLLPPEGKA